MEEEASPYYRHSCALKGRCCGSSPGMWFLKSDDITFLILEKSFRKQGFSFFLRPLQYMEQEHLTLPPRRISCKFPQQVHLLTPVPLSLTFNSLLGPERTHTSFRPRRLIALALLSHFTTIHSKWCRLLNVILTYCFHLLNFSSDNFTSPFILVNSITDVRGISVIPDHMIVDNFSRLNIDFHESSNLLI